VSRSRRTETVERELVLADVGVHVQRCRGAPDEHGVCGDRDVHLVPDAARLQHHQAGLELEDAAVQVTDHPRLGLKRSTTSG